MSKQISICNLPPSTNGQELRKLFEQFGEVNNIRLDFDLESGSPLREGTIVMEDSDDAITAIASLNGTLLLGHKIQVFDFKRR